MLRALREATMDQNYVVRSVGQLIHRGVSYFDAVRLQLLGQHSGNHDLVTHSSLASHNYVLDVSSRNASHGLLRTAGLHLLALGLCGLEVIIAILGGFENHKCDEEGDGGRKENS